jgi:hypothetical protein
VRLCKTVNLRKLFTDGAAIWTQRCRRIRACLDITFIYIYIYRDYIYIDVKTCFYALTVTRWLCLSTQSRDCRSGHGSAPCVQKKSRRARTANRCSGHGRSTGKMAERQRREWLCAWSHVKDVRVFGESVLRLVNLYIGRIGHCGSFHWVSFRVELSCVD